MRWKNGLMKSFLPEQTANHISEPAHDQKRSNRHFNGGLLLELHGGGEKDRSKPQAGGEVQRKMIVSSN